jgi:hypothetical protein
MCQRSITEVFIRSFPEDGTYRSCVAHVARTSWEACPQQDNRDFVYSWLERHGVPCSSISKTYDGASGRLTLTGVPASQPNNIFCASYQHAGTKIARFPGR